MTITGPNDRAPHRFDHVLLAVQEVLDPALEVVDAMDRVVEACVRFTSASEAGVVLADEAGTLHVIASTSERTSDAEEVQLGTHEGVALEAFHLGRAVDVPDVSTHGSEWPAFVETLEERGLGGAYAEPIRLRSGAIGSLCLFAAHTQGHDDEDVVLIQMLGDAATAALIRQRVVRHPRSHQEQVADAIAARITIEQAKGALAFRRDIAIEQTFQVIRDTARRDGRALHAVAEDIVRRGADLTSGD